MSTAPVHETDNNMNNDSRITTGSCNNVDNNINNDNKTVGKLRALGFCGVDDSVDPTMLLMVCNSYPIVEFGVLFRPDKEGQPRYPTIKWVQQLATTIDQAKTKSATTTNIKLAAHLCGIHVNNILDGTCDEFIEQLVMWNFTRVQINATAVNGVDTTKLSNCNCIPNIIHIVDKFSTQIEFIIQCNNETKLLWYGLQQYYYENRWPTNVSMLYDESKGTGLETKVWPTVSTLTTYEIGFAGGIGPTNITKVLQDLSNHIVINCNRQSFWIDMESSLRSICNNNDIFDIVKCYQVIRIAVQLGFISNPSYL